MISIGFQFDYELNLKNHSKKIIKHVVFFSIFSMFFWIFFDLCLIFLFFLFFLDCFFRFFLIFFDFNWIFFEI